MPNHTPEEVLNKICDIEITNAGAVNEARSITINPQKLAEFLSLLTHLINQQ